MELTPQYALECALCGTVHDLWYVMVKNSPGELPLKAGDVVCKLCSETLPTQIQDALHWINRGVRRQYLESPRKKESKCKDEDLRRLLAQMAKLIFSQDAEILDLKASVAVLKLVVAGLKGEELESAMQQFRLREQKVLAGLPASQRLQEVREVMDVLEKYGKHEA